MIEEESNHKACSLPVLHFSLSSLPPSLSPSLPPSPCPYLERHKHSVAHMEVASHVGGRHGDNVRLLSLGVLRLEGGGRKEGEGGRGDSDIIKCCVIAVSSTTGNPSLPPIPPSFKPSFPPYLVDRLEESLGLPPLVERLLHACKFILLGHLPGLVHDLECQGG